MSDAKSPLPPATWEALRPGLRAWYEQARRPLPWRTAPSLYRTVVSEFMCQQTQIDTVLPYFARWMERFPDFEALAVADEEAVLTAWSGLGYYARARNLQRLARDLAGRKDPPRTPEAWRKLPGIGPYTAAAITSIAFAHPAAVVDGNVVRVLARVASLDQPFASSQAAARSVQPLADAFLDPERPGDHNQALMELGATVCTKHRPSCLVCPLRAACRACREGIAEQLPRIARRATERLTVQRLWLVHDGALLLQRGNAGKRRLARLVELPTWPEGLSLRGAALAGRFQRGISHQRITEEIYAPSDASRAKLLEDASTHLPDGFFHPVAELESLPLSGPHRRWIHALRDDFKKTAEDDLPGPA